MGAHPDDTGPLPSDARAVRSPCSSEDLKARFEAEAVPLLPRFYPAALRLTGNPADAEDLLQETFLRAYRGYPRFQSGTNLHAWLYRILSNTFIDGYRKRSRQPKTVPEGALLYTNGAERNVEVSAEAIVIDSLPEEELQTALSSLPEGHRRVLLLCDVDGFTYKEIAQIVGVPIGTVMSRLHVAEGRSGSASGQQQTDSAWRPEERDTATRMASAERARSERAGGQAYDPVPAGAGRRTG
jgi:RNA polymerase sigma-70 factor, ECF subfamily